MARNKQTDEEVKEKLRRSVVRARVEGMDTDCYEWTKAKSSFGYGRIRFRGKQETTHRASYILFVGEIPEGMLVRHRCDNPACIRPRHLQLGTQKDNVADCVKRKRLNKAKGQRHGMSKLTEKQVKEMRSKKNASKSHRYYAEKFDVTYELIWLVRTKVNQVWVGVK